MELAQVRHVYEHEGPFATVYLEGRSPGEDASNQTRLRWEALREKLAQQDASEAALAAIESALHDVKSGEVQINGRVLVSNETGVVLDEPWDAALGSGDDAHWAVLPELGSYLREQARSVRVLTAIVDHEGAHVRQEVVATQHANREIRSETVEGSADEGVHKPRGGALSHKQIQRRADETLKQNAKDIVSHLNAVSTRFHPAVFVLAGDVRARTAIREQLPGGLSDLVVETDAGGRDINASDDALDDQLRQIADDHSSGRAESCREQLNQGLAHDKAMQGAQAVAHAAEMGAVDTLLFQEESAATREAFLIKTCAETDSSVDLVPQETGLEDGVGALLRFPMNR